jgi:hypothetical protein
MADPAFYDNAGRFSEAMKEYAELKPRLAALEDEWITLAATD